MRSQKRPSFSGLSVLELMVSGLVPSPEDQDRICFEEASPIVMVSKLLMSIMSCLGLFLDVFLVLLLGRLVRLAALALCLDLLLGLVRGSAGLRGSHA